MARAYFNETQRFTQWWIYLVLAMVFASWIYTMVTLFPETQKEDGNSAKIMLIVNSIIIPFTIYALLRILKLKTRIRNEGIYYRFVPMHFKEKFLAREDIERFEVRKYRPLPEYGGWGIKTRGSKYGKAINVSGNQGLQLYLTNGKKLLIGTQKPREIEKAMEAMRPVNS
jgi:hypothetical protein